MFFEDDNLFLAINNDSERTEKALKFVNEKLQDIDYKINRLKVWKESTLDYYDEIHDLELHKRDFTVLKEILTRSTPCMVARR